MKAKIVFILIFISCSMVNASKLDTSKIILNGNAFYLISNARNSSLCVFLHGGVSNSVFKDQSNVSLDFVLEKNSTFSKSFLNKGYDLLIPITNEKLNWIDHAAYTQVQIESVLNSDEIKGYKSTIISGFSDGGTSAYKLFYSYLDFYDKLIVFNGYPQHQNFYQKVDYTLNPSKTVIFCGTLDDQTIQYEFLLVEYEKQKKVNPNTFVYFVPGKHSFKYYSEEDFELITNLMTDTSNKKTEAIHGLVINDSLVEFYKFRKKTLKKYRFGESVYQRNLEQRKLLSKNVD